MSTVDGVVVAPDANGVVQGNGGAVDKMAGGSGNDTLKGQAAFNQYYGGAGSDTFIISAKFALSNNTHDGASTNWGDLYAYVTDFQGAGGWSATNNDFIAFEGFGTIAQGATLEVLKVGTANANGAVLYNYAIHSADGQHVFNFLLNSLNGQALGQGDFNFY